MVSSKNSKQGRFRSAILALVCAVTTSTACLAPSSSNGLDDRDDDQTSDKKKKTSTKTPTEPTEMKPPPTQAGPGVPGTAAPELALLSPASGAQNAPSITVTLAGSGFTASSVVKFNGQAVSAQLQSANSMSAVFPQARLAQVGSFPVVVSSNGVDSNPISFSVVSATTTVTLSALSPARASQFAAATPLTVTGAGFAQGAKILFNGAELATTFDSATQLRTIIPATSLATGGSFPVSVSSGGSLSAPIIFTVDAQATPSFTSVNITGVFEGAGAQSVIVRGTNFDTTNLRVAVYSSSNPTGAAYTPTNITATAANVTIPASHFAFAGVVSLKVYNLLPNGMGRYAPQTQTITATGQSLSVSTATPLTFRATDVVTVEISGTGFTPQSLVEFDGGLCTATSTECRTLAPTSSTSIRFQYLGTVGAGNSAARVKNGTTFSTSSVTFSLTN